MALPILDGNQTSTTLATTVSGGAHYPNHIIANGTVTANVPLNTDGYSGVTGVRIIGAGFDGGLRVQGINPQTFNAENLEEGGAIPVMTYDNQALSISGTVTANVLFSATAGGSMPPQVVALGFYNGNDAGIVAVDDSSNKLPIAGTVTVGNSVTIGSLPVQLSTTTIGGTSRLNVTLSSATTVGATAPSYGNLSGGSDGTNFRAILTDTSGRTVVTGSTSILGTSTVTFTAITGSTSIIGTPSVTFGTIAGTVTANVSSTTVTVSALPSGALTTRFGSVTTANTAQLTAAVTNTSRKYLLAQNISAGTVTIGIGFSPTTTQGIQLTAGGGISFDSFCPTGAVYWLGATTGANFTILEG